MNITVTMQHPPIELSMNGRAHWGRKGELARRYRGIAFYLTKEAISNEQRNGFTGTFTPTGYAIYWYYKGREPDDDNVVTRCKSIRDGACDAFGIDDRSLRLRGVERVHARGGELCGKVRVVFDDGKHDATL